MTIEQDFEMVREELPSSLSPQGKTAHAALARIEARIQELEAALPMGQPLEGWRKLRKAERVLEAARPLLELNAVGYVKQVRELRQALADYDKEA